MQEINPKYAAIINLERPKSARPKMSNMQRAAQFSPFAALNGHQDAIDETGRYVEKRRELTNEEKLALNEKLKIVVEYQNTDEVFNFTYFEPDPYKIGGTYEVKTGSVKRIDEYNDDIIFSDNSRIKIGYLIDISSSVFDRYIML